MSDRHNTDSVEFAGFRLDRSKRRLTSSEGVEIALTPKVFNTLAYLVAHPGEIVEKRALFDAVWPGVIVEENNLNQAISTLRRVLGDSRDAPRFIVTVRGGGYRFVAPVRTLDAAAATEAERTPAAASEPMHSAFNPARVRAELIDGLRRRMRTAVALAALLSAAVLALWLIPPSQDVAPSDAATAAAPSAATAASVAVLPFQSLSSDPEQAFFADGLSEELINRFDQIEGLRVIGRTSSFVYKTRGTDLRAIGEALGARNLLEGSVRKGAGQLRVTAQLVDAANGFVLWSETYDRPEGDALAVQQDIAQAVAKASSVALGAADASDPFFGLGPKSSEAYDRYLLASGLLRAFGGENARRAEHLLREAIAIDPEFLAARFALADAVSFVSMFTTESALGEDSDEIDQVLARAAAEVPREWAKSWLRAVRQRRTGDWFGAHESFAAARALAPASARAALERSEGTLRLSVGRVAESIDGALVQVRDDPLSLGAAYHAQRVLDLARRWDEAEQHYLRSRDLAGDKSGNALARHLRALGMGDPALIDATFADSIASGLGREGDRVLYAVRLDRSAALEVLRDQIAGAREPGTMAAIMAAAWAAHYGDIDLALEGIRTWLQMLPVEAYSIWLPALAPARKDPRFKDIARDYGFLAYWRGTGQWSDFCKPLGENDFECW